MLTSVEPSILYFGTPVVVVSSLNPDGSTNIAPISSAWWIGWSCMLGFDASSHTVSNLRRVGECVLNLASEDNVSHVNRLALLTGKKKVPLHKKHLGYTFAKDKFDISGFSPLESDRVAPMRIKECPIQLEATVAQIHEFGASDCRMAVPSVAVEVTIQKIYADVDYLEVEHPHRINPTKWNPLLMCFRRFYGKGQEIQPSRLNQGPEEMYAPWKLTGVKRFVTTKILSAANRNDN